MRHVLFASIMLLALLCWTDLSNAFVRIDQIKDNKETITLYRLYNKKRGHLKAVSFVSSDRIETYSDNDGDSFIDTINVYMKRSHTNLTVRSSNGKVFDEMEATERLRDSLETTYYYLSADKQSYEPIFKTKKAYRVHFAMKRSNVISASLPTKVTDCGPNTSINLLQEASNKISANISSRYKMIDPTCDAKQQIRIIEAFNNILEPSASQNKYLTCLDTFHNLSDRNSFKENVELKMIQTRRGDLDAPKITCERLEESGRYDEKTQRIALSNTLFTDRSSSNTLERTLFHEILHANGGQSELVVSWLEECCSGANKMACTNLKQIDGLLPSLIELPGVSELLKKLEDNPAATAALLEKLQKTMKPFACDNKNSSYVGCRQKYSDGAGAIRSVIEKECMSVDPQWGECLKLAGMAEKVIEENCKSDSCLFDERSRNIISALSIAQNREEFKRMALERIAKKPVHLDDQKTSVPKVPISSVSVANSSSMDSFRTIRSMSNALASAFDTRSSMPRASKTRYVTNVKKPTDRSQKKDLTTSENPSVVSSLPDRMLAKPEMENDRFSLNNNSTISNGRDILIKSHQSSIETAPTADRKPSSIESSKGTRSAERTKSNQSQDNKSGISHKGGSSRSTKSIVSTAKRSRSSVDTRNAAAVTRPTRDQKEIAEAILKSPNPSELLSETKFKLRLEKAKLRIKKDDVFHGPSTATMLWDYDEDSWMPNR